MVALYDFAAALVLLILVFLNQEIGALSLKYKAYGIPIILLPHDGHAFNDLHSRGDVALPDEVCLIVEVDLAVDVVIIQLQLERLCSLAVNEHEVLRQHLTV